MPVYAVEDSNGRHRMLKYTPEHMHCLATIHAALAPPNTGVLAIQTSTANAQVVHSYKAVPGLDVGRVYCVKSGVTDRQARELQAQ